MSRGRAKVDSFKSLMSWPRLEPGYTITAARPEHLEALAEIELAAATMLKGMREFLAGLRGSMPE